MATTAPPPSDDARNIHPILGVFAVLLGASIATFFGRLLSVGTPDLRGVLGLDVDSASWMATSYNMGQMFLGPFSVYLGGIFGPRRVLLGAAGVLTACCLAMPFAGHFGILLGLLAVSGLAAGTFYPLTLSVILRNLPLPYIHYGIAAYVFDIIATTHLAHSYEGWIFSSLTWQWLFWTVSVICPVMMLLIVFGIPKHPLPHPKPGEEPPSWVGFFFASAGGTLIYAALDQAQRLDWWRSGTFVGLLISGLVFLCAALIRRLTKPNPLVDVAFLLHRNTILLGMTVLFFRFVLLASVVLVPTYLGAVQTYRPEQTGHVLLWLAVPEFLAGMLAVYLLNKVDERLILAGGFFLVALGCLIDSQISSVWSGNNFYVGQLVLSIGLGLAFNGLAGAIILTGLNTGATKSAAAALTFSGYFQTIRLLGGEFGSTFVLFFLHNRQVHHFNLLVSGFTPGSPAALSRARLLAGAVSSQSPTTNVAAGRAAHIFGATVNQQAFTLSVMDGFVMLTYAGIACLLVVSLFAPVKIGLKQIIRGDLGQTVP